MGLKNTWFNRTFRPKAMTQEKIEGQTADVRSMVQDIPGYDIPPELAQMLEMYQSTSEGMGAVTDLAGEATDVARARTSMSEAPGAGLARKDIRQSTAGTVQNILEAGGGSASAMGAIQQAGQAQQGAYQNLAAQNQAFQSQAERDLMGALTSEAGITSNVMQAQAGMQAQGLNAMIGQKGMQQEYDLNKYLTGLQFETGQLGNLQGEMQNIKNRRAQMLSSLIGAGTSVATAGLA